MTTHPDVLWELVRERQASLREEAEQYNRVSRFLGRKVRPNLAPRRSRETVRGRVAGGQRAGTLAACAPGVAE